VRDGLVHAAGIAWADGGVLIGLAVGDGQPKQLGMPRQHFLRKLPWTLRGIA
jgi:hypothetical protein